MRKKGAKFLQTDVKSAIVMIADNGTRQYAGLVLREPIQLCGYHCYTTQIKGVITCVLRDMDEPIVRTSFKAHFDPTTTDLQTQLSYLHISTNLRMYERFDVLQMELCKLERKTLFNKIQGLAGTGNPYAMLDLYGPGHTVLVAGAAAYIVRCQEVEVARVEYGNCTEEVPVRDVETNSTTIRFADPYTWVLRDFPTVVPCSDITPIRWKVKGTWYCATPTARRCESPDQLQTSTSAPNPIKDDLTEGLEGGLFTLRQKEQHRAFHQAMSSRKAVTAKISNTATGFGTTQGELGIVIDREEIDLLTLTIGGTVFPFFFPLFGKFWVAVIGVLMTIVMIKSLADWMIRSYILWNERGWGWWMLGAFWATLFALIRTPHEVIKAAMERLKPPMTAETSFIETNNPGATHTIHLTHKQLLEMIQDEIRAGSTGRPSLSDDTEIPLEQRNTERSTLLFGYPVKKN